MKSHRKGTCLFKKEKDRKGTRCWGTLPKMTFFVLKHDDLLNFSEPLPILLISHIFNFGLKIGFINHFKKSGQLTMQNY
jgi:hypothetical protein